MPEGFDMALRLLPEPLRAAAEALPVDQRQRVEELRLRGGREPAVLAGGRERVFCPGHRLTPAELWAVLERASGSSLHSYSRQLCCGYLTARGGVRVGVCGTGGPGIEGIRDVSSLALRIPRQIKSAGGELMPSLRGGGRSLLILSPPGGGKTTFLRELIRCTSEQGCRVAVADEREELSAMWNGQNQFDLGRCTDVLCGFPKAEGAMMLLRSMTPQLIAVDEITAREDVAAMETVANCGVKLFATAHAAAVQDLSARPLYRQLLDMKLFDAAVLIENHDGWRSYREVPL